LRHTFASPLIQQGESVAYVKEQMGHSSIQITVDVYGHLVPGGNRAAVDRLDDAPPSATQAQPDAVFAPPRQRVSRLQSVVTLTFTSWNLIGKFLRQLDSLRGVA
jgi:integrase